MYDASHSLLIEKARETFKTAEDRDKNGCVNRFEICRTKSEVSEMVLTSSY